MKSFTFEKAIIQLSNSNARSEERADSNGCVAELFLKPHQTHITINLLIQSVKWQISVICKVNQENKPEEFLFRTFSFLNLQEFTA